MSADVKSEWNSDIVSDLALVTLVTVICGLLAVHFEWSEKLFSWTRRSEAFQLDEVAFVLLSLAIGMAWFSARRWREARRQLHGRLAVQIELERILGEQRRLARDFVDQQESERKRLCQELHDELGQFVNAIKLDAVALRAASWDLQQVSQTEVAERARSIIVNADLVQQSIARLMRELRPVGLDELGLTAAIEHCVNVWRSRLEPAQLSVAIDEHVDTLDENRTLALYRTVQEALTNCARHARASRIDVRIDWFDGDGAQPPGALVRVEDDGVGADLGAAPTGLGLIGMRERVTGLGGSLTIESAPRSGFRIVARVPAIEAASA